MFPCYPSVSLSAPSEHSSVPSLKALFFPFSSSFRSLVIQGLFSGYHLAVVVGMMLSTQKLMYSVMHDSPANHEVDVISMEMTSVCGFKTLLQCLICLLWPPLHGPCAHQPLLYNECVCGGDKYQVMIWWGSLHNCWKIGIVDLSVVKISRNR